MQLIGQVLGSCVIILCYNLCTCTKHWEDEDTVIVEAAPEKFADVEKATVGIREKRQIGSGNSIFAGIPGWGMFGHNFGNTPGFGGLHGFSGFQLPGFSGGGIQMPMPGIFQLPIQQPQPPKPVKPVQSSCYTANGEVGLCVQFRQCYPLLFSSAEDEQRNPGLAYSLRASAGVCNSDSSGQNNNLLYLSEISTKESQICCSNEAARPTVPTTTQIPPVWTWPTQNFEHQKPATTQRTTWGPAWSPEPTTQRTTWGPAWSPEPTTQRPTWGQVWSPEPTTQRPTWGPVWSPETTQRTTWGPPWSPDPTTQRTTTWGPAWSQQPHWPQQTQRPQWPPSNHFQQPGWPPQNLGQQTPPTTQEPPVEPYNCPGGYIIGGSPVQGRQYPYVVSIKDGRTNRHLCGGSLLSSRSVLTAAHCVKQLGPQQVAGLRAFLGANDIAATFNNPCIVVRKVRNIKYHRGFSMRTLHDDIAILTLESPVTTGGNIQTVSLSGNRVAPGGKAVVTGWGGLSLGGQPVGNLRHVTLDLIANDLCAAKYVGSAPAGITQHMVCAGSPGRDACLGDSGGPLVMNGQQVGIVSFGTGCGTLPGVYTRISSYMSWINKNIS